MPLTSKWVLFELQDRSFGVSIDHVLEMVQLGRVHEAPLSPEYIRGLMNLRGNVITIMDLRKRLGMKGRREEIQDLVEALNARERDHTTWLDDLRASLEDGREFTHALDPRKCPFGAWLQGFETDNELLSSQLEKFERLHRHVHELAATLIEMVQEGKRDKAIEALNRAWTRDLARVKLIFEETRKLLLDELREIVIVAKCKDRKMGLVVDSVLEIQDYEDKDIESDEEIFSEIRDPDLVYGIAKRDREVKILLDTERIFGSAV